ncbi:MAG: helix-turn-helix domain-containing protein [Halobacteriales archaeon]
MAVSAQVYVRHPDLALTHTIQSLPDAEIGVVSDAGTDPYHDANFFWIEASDFETVEATLAEDPTVADFTPIITDDTRQTYRIMYSSDAKLVSPRITEIGGIVVESRSHLEGWMLGLSLQNNEALYELNEHAKEEDIYLDVLELQHADTTPEVPDFGLTEAQRETLTAAYLHGHYDEPREAFLEDLAELLGVSRTAISGRLRRGSANLIEAVVLDAERE